MPDETVGPLSESRPGNKAPHLVVLAACLGILMTAAILTPSGADLRIGPVTLPGLCFLRLTTGIPCPGCGLTRSVVAAVRGDWEGSVYYHRLGPLVVFFLAMQAVYRIAWLGLPAVRTSLSRAGRFLDLALIPLMVLLFINWIPTLAHLLGQGG